MRRVERVPRPTPLPQGMSGWLDALGGAMLNRLSVEQRAGAEAEVLSLLEPVLCEEDEIGLVLRPRFS